MSTELMVSHVNQVRTIASKVEQGGETDPWKARHARAWDKGSSLKLIIMGLALYADEHRARYESKIGDDGVLGREWSDAVRGVRGLLNGELGGLDGGTLDQMLWGMLDREGFEE